MSPLKQVLAEIVATAVKDIDESNGADPSEILKLVEALELVVEQRNSWIKNSPTAAIQGIVQNLIRGEDAELADKLRKAGDR